MSNTMENVKDLLNRCTREEFHSEPSGTKNVYWYLDGEEVASGCFETKKTVELNYVWYKKRLFYDQEARELEFCGALGKSYKRQDTIYDLIHMAKACGVEFW